MNTSLRELLKEIIEDERYTLEADWDMSVTPIRFDGNTKKLEISFSVVEYPKKDKSEFEYPIFKRLKQSAIVYKFISLNRAINTIDGEKSMVSEHTRVDVWEDVLYDKENDLYDGQPVGCRSNHALFEEALRFYDVKNKCTFTANSGDRGGFAYINIKAIPHDKVPEWMWDKQKKLQY